ncbi:MAG: STELLO glycosyltransferase family protein [Akkermansiaceae bacterium]|nr:STELLO glycosyltransferase family protein [Akkermansiaceae bacterium]MDP4721649.1 STELLO glycosyltransferase family protein [Akkermansiaceae bacterium]MDP4997018.1 STELLO glycosyltransferase family protein [Akkermansiaceae bacterium]
MPTSLVVTSINAPTAAVKELASGSLEHGWDFIMAGDSKSPTDFSLDGCRFLSLEAQRGSGFSMAKICPERSYTRKNLAYLEAMASGADVIVETDDDNHPLDEFWQSRVGEIECKPVAHDGWVNAYGYFTEEFIYPRGLPLKYARDAVPEGGGMETVFCPVQQGLADSDPDVDAVYRMLFPLPFHFEKNSTPVLLRDGAWCPFNSQNTTFQKCAFPLLYLPAECSFRMTDIWRSFVAQRILQARGMGVLFHSPTVWQDRNDHDLQKDFTDELPGYNHNAEMREALVSLRLDDSMTSVAMLELCYQELIRRGWVGQGEEKLLTAWIADLAAMGIQ